VYPTDPVNKLDLTGLFWEDNVVDGFGFTWRDAAHFAINIVVGVLVVAVVAATCTATMGIACPFIVGAAYGLLFGVMPHFVLDAATGHRTEPIEAVSYVALDGVVGGATAEIRRQTRDVLIGHAVRAQQGIRQSTASAASSSTSSGLTSSGAGGGGRPMRFL